MKTILKIRISAYPDIFSAKSCYKDNNFFEISKQCCGNFTSLADLVLVHLVQSQSQLQETPNFSLLNRSLNSSSML